MRGRSIGFIVLNVLISAGVALGILQVLPSQGGGADIQIATVAILVTQTPDPDGDATRIASAVESTVGARMATFEATAAPQVDLPPEIAADLNTPATIDPEALSANPAAQETASALPDGCVLHVVEEGETPFGIAEEYGVNGFRLLTVNNLTEETATQLQIGDTLIVPLPNCPIEVVQTPTPERVLDVTEEVTAEATQEVTEEVTEEATEEVTATPTGTPTFTPTATPTVTPTRTPVLAPTASSAQVEITEFINPGDITAEGVTILNRGSVVDITGWTLSDAQGNEFVFPEQRLFTNGSITVYTRAGEDTPVVLYWGRSTAVWGDEGDVATLTDANGRVQSSVRVNGDE